MTTVDKLIALMSPETLVAFIGDIQDFSKGADRFALQAERKAKEALVAIMGEEEAEQMINAGCR